MRRQSRKWPECELLCSKTVLHAYFVSLPFSTAVSTLFMMKLRIRHLSWN